MYQNFSLVTCMVAVFFCSNLLFSQSGDADITTIAFYNVENLFDIQDDPETRDEDYTPEGRLRYTEEDYDRKLKNIARVLKGIGGPEDPDGPEIVGLAEVENLQVLRDLCKKKELEGSDYRIIHEDSEDHRGIDVALLYKDGYFMPLAYSYHRVGLWDQKGRPIKTRDVLHVHGILLDEEIHLIVNHWPSRRGGSINSSPRREKAAYVNRQIMNKIRQEDQRARIVVMGDFNDDPFDNSIKQGLMGVDKESGEHSGLVNPMQTMFKKGWNSMVYRDRLHLFDQILFSNSLLAGDESSWKFYKSGIYKADILLSEKGKYRGYPRRAFSNGKFSGGYSDHFPVYLQLRRK